MDMGTISVLVFGLLITVCILVAFAFGAITRRLRVGGYYDAPPINQRGNPYRPRNGWANQLQSAQPPIANLPTAQTNDQDMLQVTMALIADRANERKAIYQDRANEREAMQRLAHHLATIGQEAYQQLIEQVQAGNRLLRDRDGYYLETPRGETYDLPISMTPHHIRAMLDMQRSPLLLEAGNVED